MTIFNWLPSVVYAPPILGAFLFGAVIAWYFLRHMQAERIKILKASQQSNSSIQEDTLLLPDLDPVPKDPIPDIGSPTESMENERFSQLLRNTDGVEEFLEHLPGEFRKARYRQTKKEIEGKMSEDERQQEAALKRKQLEDIFKLMQEQQEKFGPQSLEDIQEQMKLYSF